MLRHRGIVRTSKILAKIEGKEANFFSKIYEGHIRIWFKSKKNSKLSHACVPLSLRVCPLKNCLSLRCTFNSHFAYNRRRKMTTKKVLTTSTIFLELEQEDGILLQSLGPQYKYDIFAASLMIAYSPTCMWAVKRYRDRICTIRCQCHLTWLFGKLAVNFDENSRFYFRKIVPNISVFTKIFKLL